MNIKNLKELSFLNEYKKSKLVFRNVAVVKIQRHFFRKNFL